MGHTRGPFFMKKLKLLELLINDLRKSDRILLFGENSKIKLLSTTFSSQKKSYVVDIKLIVDEPELCEESFPDGLHHLVSRAFKFMGYDEKVIIISTLEVV